MKFLSTKFREFIRNSVLSADYFFWFFLDSSKFKRINKNKIKKILIIHLGAIGELIVSTPIISALKKELNCSIDYMVSKGKEPVFFNNPHINKTLTYNPDFKKFLHSIKNEKYNLAVILNPGSLKLSWLCLRAGIKYRIGCFSGVKNLPSFFFTRRTFPVNKKHAVEKNLAMIEQIGIHNTNPKLEIYLSDKEKNLAKDFAKKFNLSKYAVIHPGFGSIFKYKYPSRLWPIERYAEIIDFLIEKYKFKIILTGLLDEKKFLESIISKVKNKDKVVLGAGRFNLREFIGIISNSELVLTVSTGASHIATSFNVPLVDLIGRGDPWEWKPWGKKENIRFLFNQEVCTGCNLDYCRKNNNECLKSISAKDVKDSIINLLDS